MIPTKKVITENLKRRKTSKGAGSIVGRREGTLSDDGTGISIKLVLIVSLFCLYNVTKERISMKGISMSTTNRTNISNIIDFTKSYTTAAAFSNPVDKNNNITLRDSSLLRDPTTMNQDQPIPAAFVYTKELYNTRQNLSLIHI